MSRFFFHFRCADEFCRDDEGTECAGYEEAYIVAYKSSVTMWSELLAERIDPRLASFELTGGVDS